MLFLRVGHLKVAPEQLTGLPMSLPHHLPQNEQGPIRCLAFDFGAGSGRAMLGCLDGGTLSLEEVHRFRTATYIHNGQLCWDADSLYRGLEVGLDKARRHGPLHSVGIDSWGVDFGLLDEAGQFVTPPLHYRNGHGMRGLARGLLPLEEMHRLTGAQCLDINTVYQLLALAERNPELLDRTKSLLMISDLMTAHLTGKYVAEHTLASTSGLFDQKRGDWHWKLLSRLGLPEHIFPPVVMPGTVCGRLREAFRGNQDSETVVIAVGAHDTASAVAGLDLASDDAFLILGSWSLLGVENDTPIYDERTQCHGFGNEGGVDGTHRLIANINGLYLIQALRDSWEALYGVSLKYSDITEAARKTQVAESLRIDPNDERFFSSENMIHTIDLFCAEREITPPSGLGDYAVAIYRGLADQVAAKLDVLECVFERPVGRIHVGGGGSQDSVLCENIAMATGKPLCFGATEASAYGNVLMQCCGLGIVSSLSDARKLLPKRSV